MLTVNINTISEKAPKNWLKCTPFVVPRMVWNCWGTFENTCKNMEHFMYPTTLYPNWCGIGAKNGGGTFYS